MSTITGELDTIRTQIPARLDRLPWSRFHWRIVIGLLAAIETQSVSVWLKSASSAAALSPESAERPRIRRASVVLPAPPFVVAMVMMLMGTPLPRLLGCPVPISLGCY